MLYALVPPAPPKNPPTYKLLPITASAETNPPFTPESTADQLLPSQLATYFAFTPPALSKYPPAYKVVPITASEVISLFVPDPRGDQVVPSHFAMLLIVVGPATVKPPAT